MEGSKSTSRSRPKARPSANAAESILLTRSGVIGHFQSFSDVETQRWMTQAQPSAEQPNGRLGGGVFEGVLETYSCMRQFRTTSPVSSISPNIRSAYVKAD